jgi:Uma2 family endonuclease
MLVCVTGQPVGRHHHRYADYLALEEVSNVKHEYLDGEIYAMAGGTPDHAALAMAVGAALVGQLGGKACRVFSSDLRVRVLATGLATYPDVTVVCGPLERDPDSRTTVTNPTLVVEVLSDGTEDYDRGEKLEHHRQVPSLRECLLVSHRRPSLELWRREPDGVWSRQEAGPGAALELLSVGCSLAVDDIYRGGFQDL